jgi:hypothetical protein
LNGTWPPRSPARPGTGTRRSSGLHVLLGAARWQKAELQRTIAISTVAMDVGGPDAGGAVFAEDGIETDDI